MDCLIKPKNIQFLKRFRFGIKRRLPWAMAPLLFPDQTSKNQSTYVQYRRLISL